MAVVVLAQPLPEQEAAADTAATVETAETTAVAAVAVGLTSATAWLPVVAMPPGQGYGAGGGGGGTGSGAGAAGCGAPGIVIITWWEVDA